MFLFFAILYWVIPFLIISFQEAISPSLHFYVINSSGTFYFQKMFRVGKDCRLFTDSFFNQKLICNPEKSVIISDFY